MSHDQLIEQVRRAACNGEHLRLNLPGGGRLHLDRALPFLTLYRQPPHRNDPGTERLVLGEAAYLVTRDHDPALTTALSDTLAKIQGERFGAFLLLEVWATAEPAADGQPAFRLLAPDSDCPVQLLEILESGLLDIRVEACEARVQRHYDDHWAPPGLPVVGEHCIRLGLEVSPLYRDAGGNLLPFELKTLHRQLARVLRRTFHDFTHRYTHQRPAHYHQLGGRWLDSLATELDRKLVALDASFDLLLAVTPVNTDAAWAAFQDSEYRTIPQFHYRARTVDPALVKRALYALPLEALDDPTLVQLFAAKQEELDRQLTLIADRATPRFLADSIGLNGGVDDTLLAKARELLARLPTDTDATGEVLDADAFAAATGTELAHYREQLPGLEARVELRDDVPGVMVSRGHVLVGRDLTVAAERADALLAHEVGTHIVTHYNGGAQPLKLLQAGLADYEPLQEGLAVLQEYLVGQLTVPRLRLLAARVVAAHGLIHGADFLETFHELHRELGFAPRAVFDIAMRFHRGGGYVKDAVYLRGLDALLGYLGAGGDLEVLFTGKFSLEQVPLIQELRWRGMLRDNPLRPRHLDDPAARQRLQRLRDRPVLLTLAESGS